MYIYTFYCFGTKEANGFAIAIPTVSSVSSRFFLAVNMSSKTGKSLNTETVKILGAPKSRSPTLDCAVHLETPNSKSCYPKPRARLLDNLKPYNTVHLDIPNVGA